MTHYGNRGFIRLTARALSGILRNMRRKPDCTYLILLVDDELIKLLGATA